MRRTFFQPSTLGVLALLLPFTGGEEVFGQIPTRRDFFIRTGPDSLDATLFMPDVPPPDSLGHPGMIFVHGFGQTKDVDTLSASLWGRSGYASLCYSVRGHGKSSGRSGIMGEVERADLAMVVEAVRSLPGVNRNRVGVQGGSQGGLHTLWCATDRLPVAAGTADVITPRWASDMTENGSFRSTLMFLLNNAALRYAPIVDSLRELLRADDHLRFRALFVTGRDVDTAALYSSHMPIASFVKWQDHYFGAAGMVEWFRESGASRRFYGGTGGHFSDNIQAELQYQWGIVNRWHDRFVRGTPNGVDLEPPVTISASRLPRSTDGSFTWDRTEMQAWPSAGVVPYRLYLRSDSLLTPVPGRPTPDSILHRHVWNGTYGFDSAWVDRFSGPRFEAAFPQKPLRFLTRPLQRDVLWFGAPQLTFTVRSESDRFPLHCQIFEVDQAGAESFVNGIPLTVRGWTPGRTGTVTAAGMMHAHRFTSGSRIMVKIMGIDTESRDGWGTMPLHLPLFANGEATIYADSGHPSFIALPLDGNPVLQTAIADLSLEFDTERKRVRVRWTTDGEADNGGFWVLKRRQGEADQTAGFLLPQAGPNNPSPLAYVFDDSTVGEGTWLYRLRQVSRSGEYNDTREVPVQILLSSAGPAVAHSFRLAPNFPNPFNPATTIHWSLERTEEATVRVYDVIGREVATLASGVLSAGPHARLWTPDRLPSGTYIVRLSSPTGTAALKILLLR